jgi:hypothetical protein
MSPQGDESLKSRDSLNYRPNGGAINVNLWWGWELLAFAIIMPLPGRRSCGWLLREVAAPMIPVKVRSGVGSQ